MKVDDFIDRLEKERASYHPVKKWFMSKSMMGYNGWYWLKNPHRIIPTAFLDSKAHVKLFCQRGVRGWADQDTWSLDYYILSWLPDALEKVAEDSHGYPSNYGFSDQDIADWVARGRSSAEQIDKNHSYNLYVAELRDIATIFREINQNHFTLEAERFEEAWERLGKIFFHLWT